MRSRNRTATWKVLAVLACATFTVGSVTACQVREVSEAEAQLMPIVNAEPSPVNIPDMRVENRSGHVDPIFPEHPIVVDESSGLATSQLLFRSSTSLIITSADIHSQLRAASLSVFAHAPMLVYSGENHAEIVAEISRLDARRVLLIGDVAIAETSGDTTVFQDPGGMRALGQITAHRFTQRVVGEEDDLVEEVIRLDGQDPVVLVPDWVGGTFHSEPDLPALPIQTRRDGMNAPVTVATNETPIASVANARAYGAHVRYLDQPDPRESDTALAAMIGLSDQPLLALGGQFGTEEELARAIMEAERDAEESGVVSVTPETRPE